MLARVSNLRVLPKSHAKVIKVSSPQKKFCKQRRFFTDSTADEFEKLKSVLAVFNKNPMPPKTSEATSEASKQKIEIEDFELDLGPATQKAGTDYKSYTEVVNDFIKKCFPITLRDWEVAPIHHPDQMFTYLINRTFPALTNQLEGLNSLKEIFLTRDYHMDPKAYDTPKFYHITDDEQYPDGYVTIFMKRNSPYIARWLDININQRRVTATEFDKDSNISTEQFNIDIPSDWATAFKKMKWPAQPPIKMNELLIYITVAGMPTKEGFYAKMQEDTITRILRRPEAISPDEINNLTNLYEETVFEIEDEISSLKKMLEGDKLQVSNKTLEESSRDPETREAIEEVYQEWRQTGDAALEDEVDDMLKGLTKIYGEKQ